MISKDGCIDIESQGPRLRSRVSGGRQYVASATDFSHRAPRLEAARTHAPTRLNRIKERFPDDFMFELSWQETEEHSRSQFVTLKQGENPKYRPHVFTELGVSMLSNVLRSRRALEVDIAIMRAFVRLREIAATNADFVQRLNTLCEEMGTFLISRNPAQETCPIPTFRDSGVAATGVKDVTLP